MTKAVENGLLIELMRKELMKYSKTRAVCFAALTAGVFLGAYAIWFGAINKFSLSTNTSNWGDFGSYAAGTAGVSFALATVWMLAETLKVQRNEMAMTREELALSRKEYTKSNDALVAQEQAARDSAKQEFTMNYLSAIASNLENVSSAKKKIRSQEVTCAESLENNNAQYFRKEIMSLEAQLGVLAVYLFENKNDPQVQQLAKPYLARHLPTFNALNEKSHLDKIKPEYKKDLIKAFSTISDEIY